MRTSSVPLRHVDRPVRGVVDCVGPGEGACSVGEVGDPADIGERSEGVRRNGKRYDARPIRQLALEVAVVERRVVVDIDEADLQLLVVRELEPRRDIRVVVELRHENLISLVPGTSKGARERKGEARHVRAEDRLFRRAAQELGRSEPRLSDERLGLAARLVRAAGVRVRLAVVARDGVDHLVRDLCPARPVEEGERLPQRCISGANRLDIEGDGRQADHVTTIARVAPATKERIDRGTGTGLGAPWNVIVLNDNHNTFQGVAAALASTIPNVSYDQGLRIADRIHNTGRAIVWSGHREPAELYWDQLRAHGLTMAPLERA